MKHHPDVGKPVPTELQRMLEAAIAEGAYNATEEGLVGTRTSMAQGGPAKQGPQINEDAYLIPNEGPRAAYADAIGAT